MRDITAWAFQESLVLRIDETTHHLVNGTEPQEQYTTNDQIVRILGVDSLHFSSRLGLHHVYLALQPDKRSI